jgi:hypothetical protein
VITLYFPIALGAGSAPGAAPTVAPTPNSTVTSFAQTVLPSVIGLIGVLIGGFISRYNSFTLERRKEERNAQAAKRRLRFLLFAEFVAYGPFSGGISLRDIELLEEAHRRLRERWNDDTLILAFDENTTNRSMPQSINQTEQYHVYERWWTR